MDKAPCEIRCDVGLRFFLNDNIGTLRTVQSCGDKHIVEADSILTMGGVKRIVKGRVRIRKLTHFESYRLMGFDTNDAEKVYQAGISKSQMYKQAGNSIVVNVLESIFKSLGDQYEEFKSVPDRSV